MEDHGQGPRAGKQPCGVGGREPGFGPDARLRGEGGARAPGRGMCPRGAVSWRDLFGSQQGAPLGCAARKGELEGARPAGCSRARAGACPCVRTAGRSRACARHGRDARQSRRRRAKKTHKTQARRTQRRRRALSPPGGSAR